MAYFTWLQHDDDDDDDNNAPEPKTHLVCLAAGLRSDPLGGELRPTALARPQLFGTENGF